MRLIQSKLDDYEEDDVITVWFEAWRYAREEHLIIPLVSTIIREVEEQSNKSNEPSRYKRVLNALRAVVYGISFKAKFGLTDTNSVEFNASIKDMVEREEQLNREETEEVLIEQSLYFDAYDALSKLSADENPAKIVLLIDDLDRCLPDVAIRLLEGIKLVFAQKGFVFVLGISRRVFDGYLRKIYDDFGISDFKAQEYLEKIIQLPFAIPPHNTRMDSFAKSLLDHLVKEDVDALEAILPIIGVACAYNPRITIRFVNNLLIDSAISSVPNALSFFAVTRSLQQRWWRVYNLLSNSVDGNYLCEKIVYWWLDNGENAPLGLPEIDPEKNDNEANLIYLIRGDKELQKLFETEQGRNWLSNHNERSRAIQFLYLDQLWAKITELQHKGKQMTNEVREIGQDLEDLGIQKTLNSHTDSKVYQEQIDQLKVRVQRAKWQYVELSELTVELKNQILEFHDIRNVVDLNEIEREIRKFSEEILISLDELPQFID